MPVQVIGTIFKTVHDQKDDRPTLPIQSEIALNDDKAGKPVAIHQMIGRKPLVRLREQGVEPIDD